ncbi:MAG: NAD-dependent epimerase/dehydratase family protein [Acidobacteria bacterium]|nr:NAD-dependent epimerase/dehydratase family protein [Acidobacteriota bacterium]
MNLVTGGPGFVGSHIVRALLARGQPVRCLVRPGSRRTNLDGLPVEVAVGDLTDPPSLREAVRGCRAVYHCAADYRLGARRPDAIYASNVAGTDNLLRAAADAAVERVVHTSSVGALGRRPDGRPADENTPVRPESLIGDYKKSKYEGECVAREWAGRGLPVVIVNPSTPVGERDVKPTPTGKMILDFLNRKMPAYVETGLNLIDVRDVAEGHLLAAERGRAGERYILGNRNMTLKEIFDALSGLTGIPSPKWKLPHWIPLAAAGADLVLSRLRGKDPSIPLEGVRMARHAMYFDASRAVAELGLPQNDVVPALGRAARWFEANGYVRG